MAGCQAGGIVYLLKKMQLMSSHIRIMAVGVKL